MKQDLIVILDLGSTQNTVVARQIRELGVYSEIHPHDITADELKSFENLKGLILNGGENRIVGGKPVEVSPELYNIGCPVIAIDYPQAECEKQYNTLPDPAVLQKFIFEDKRGWTVTGLSDPLDFSNDKQISDLMNYVYGSYVWNKV